MPGFIGGERVQTDFCSRKAEFTIYDAKTFFGGKKVFLWFSHIKQKLGSVLIVSQTSDTTSFAKSFIPRCLKI